MKKLEKRVHNELKILGISGSYLGEKFLIHALQLMSEDNTYLCRTSELLYEDIAKCHQTSATCIKRNLRTLIMAIWENGNREHLEKIAGCHLEGCPSDIEFLNMISFYITNSSISDES